MADLRRVRRLEFCPSHHTAYCPLESTSIWYVALAGVAGALVHLGSRFEKKMGSRGFEPLTSCVWPMSPHRVATDSLTWERKRSSYELKR